LKKFKFHFPIALILIFAAESCTTNPLFDDEKNTYDRHVISGAVTLQDDRIPNNIYVWMEDLNLYDYTSDNGSFSLSLPNTPDFQGLNGAYTIFFFLGNYRYSTSTAIIRDGLFEYGEQDISGDGKVQNVTPLAELLSITTRVLKNDLILDHPDSLLIEVSLENKTALPVTTTFYRDHKNYLTGFLIKDVDAPTNEAGIYLLQGYRPVMEPISHLTKLRTYLLWDGSRILPGFVALSPGGYEIFPYIFLEQDGLPSELIGSFGDNATRISSDYLNIPLKQTTATFQVSTD
jgi:hypothetical protein